MTCSAKRPKLENNHPKLCRTYSCFVPPKRQKSTLRPAPLRRAATAPSERPPGRRPPCGGSPRPVRSSSGRRPSGSSQKSCKKEKKEGEGRRLENRKLTGPWSVTCRNSLRSNWRASELSCWRRKERGLFPAPRKGTAGSGTGRSGSKR